jgi:hypothetical protein
MDSLEEWDRNIAPLLFSISADLFWMGTKADDVLRRVKQLLRRPEWESTAQAELDKRITDTQYILARLQEAKKAYEKKETFK